MKPVRAIVGDPQPVQASFPAVADGDVLVTVTREDGTELAAGVVATDDGDGAYSFSLTSAMVARVDELTLVFSGAFSTIERTRTVYCQVAGSHYFEVSEVRELPLLDASYTDAMIIARRMAVEDQIEENCGFTAFVPRYAVERISADQWGSTTGLHLKDPWILEILSVTDDGEVIDPSEYSLNGRNLSRPAGWTYSPAGVVVRYVKGYSRYPAEDLRTAALEATRSTLLKQRRTGAAPQATQLTTEVGTLQIAIAGLRRPFGIPEVDAVVLNWAESVGEVL